MRLAERGADRRCGYANTADRSAKRDLSSTKTDADCDDSYVYTSPVGTFAADAFGLHDVLGNVWEWTDVCGSYESAPNESWASRSGECAMGVGRGGSWRFSLWDVNFPYLLGVDERLNFVGLRVARTLDPEELAGTEAALVVPAPVPETGPAAEKELLDAVRVQLAAARSPQRAENIWKRILGAHKDLLGELRHVVVRVDLRAEKGIFQRIQAGPLVDAETANALCEKLRAREQGCLVVPP